MKTRLSSADLVLTLAVVIVWGFAFVPMRIGLDEVPPFMLAALRFLCAGVPAFLFVRRPDMPWKGVVAYGFVIGVFQFGLLFVGIRLGMPAGLASLVIQLQVFFTIGLAVAFAGDRFNGWNALGSIVATAGIVVLGLHRIESGTGAALAGFIAVVAAAFAWAVGNVIAKRAGADHDVDAFSLVVWSSLVPPLPLAVASFAFEGGIDALRAVAHASWVAWACVLFMAWGATLFAYGAWNRLLHTYPTPLISPFALLIPVSGMASAALFLGEQLVSAQAVGVVLVFVGLAVNVAGPLRAGRTAR
ncbi:MAG: EamA family transporter [Betaproteobacteria bacterium]